MRLTDISLHIETFMNQAPVRLSFKVHDLTGLHSDVPRCFHQKTKHNKKIMAKYVYTHKEERDSSDHCTFSTKKPILAENTSCSRSEKVRNIPLLLFYLWISIWAFFPVVNIQVPLFFKCARSALLICCTVFAMIQSNYVFVYILYFTIFQLSNTLIWMWFFQIIFYNNGD